MIFWFVAVLVTLAICVIAFYPLLKKSVRSSTQQRDSLNKAFYFDRLQEVEQEIEQGKIEDMAQAKVELQQSLLDDIPADPEQNLKPQRQFGKGWGILFVMFVALVGGGIYSQIGSWASGAMLNNSHDKLAYFYERIKNEESEPLSDQEMNEFAMALRVELQQKPQDDKGWFMLGQLGMALDDGQLALDSFAKASQLQPQNIQYKLRHAQVLMFSADPKDKEQGEAVLKEIIRADHSNVEALSLLAFNAFEKEDYKMAAVTWGMMLKLMPEDDPRRPTIERSMQAALAMSKENEQPEKK